MSARRPQMDQVYVVAWPSRSVFKIGYSSVRRWERFTETPEVVAVYDFENAPEAFLIEEWLFDVASEMFEPAYALGDKGQARILLGHKGAGYAECFKGGPDEARSVIREAMRRAMPDASMPGGVQA